jgi:hypothetical protein
MIAGAIPREETLARWEADMGEPAQPMRFIPGEMLTLPDDIVAENLRRALHFVGKDGFGTLLLHTNEREDGVHITSSLDRPLDPLNRSLLNQLYESMGADLSEMQIRESRAGSVYQSETTIRTPYDVAFTELFTAGQDKRGGSFRVTVHSPSVEAAIFAKPEAPEPTLLQSIGKRLIGLFNRNKDEK